MSYTSDQIVYRDTGCSWHPRCLTCPFVECRYDRRPAISGGPTPQHGTLTMYRGRGCRCDACRSANAEYARKYHQHRRAVAE